MLNDDKIKITTAALRQTHEISALEDSAGKAFIDIGMAWVDEIPAATPESLATPVSDGNILIAQHNNAIVGFIHMGEMDNHGHIFEVSVGLEAQGKGIGRKLLEAGDKWAHNHGFSAITLTTFKNVSFNAPWYRKCGFKIIVPDRYDNPHLYITLKNEHEGILGKNERVAMIKKL
jgi:ribosomal protein S18 acetylase RimI-like enzyme